MKINIVLVLLFFCKTVVFAQDKNIAKIAEYIKDKKDNKAKDLLDKLDKKSEYQSDVSFWFVRTAYYRNIAIENPNKTEELEEARKSFEKLEELDKNDPQKLYSKYIPSLKKDLYEGKNKIEVKSSNNSQSSSNNQTNDNGKTVTLTEIGQGKTKEAAKYNALRNAIEKAFGTFISSNTAVLNDELVKDEIVSVSNGNIQNFEILSETQMPDGSYSSVVKATVSIGKLTTFCENKGITVEFKGGLFAANIKMQELNKKNESAVMSNLFSILNKIIPNGFDYTIEASEPINYTYNNSYWLVPIKVSAHFNKNMANLSTIIENIFSGVNMTPSEIEKYKAQNLSVYNLVFNSKSYTFRTSSAEFYLKYITTITIPLQSLNFKISNGIYTKAWFDFATCVQERTGGYTNISRYDYAQSNCPYVKNLDGNLLSLNYSIWELESPGKRLHKGWLNIEEIINNYNPNENEKYTNASFETNKWHTTRFDFSNISNNGITFNFSNFLNVSDLQKVSEYKITPINK